MNFRTLIFGAFFVALSLPSYAQLCSSETRTFNCRSGDNGLFAWTVVPSTGVIWHSDPDACTAILEFTLPGNYTVTYFVPHVYTRTYQVALVDPSAGTVNSNATDVCPQESAILNLTGQTGNIVRWEQSPDDINWQPIAHTGDTYTTPSLTTATYYRAIVNAASCHPEMPSLSKLVGVRAVTPGWVSVIAGTSSYCEGSSTTYTVAWERDGETGLFMNFEYSEKINGVWGAWQEKSGQMHDTYQADFTISVPTRVRAFVYSRSCPAHTGYLDHSGGIPPSSGGVMHTSTGENEVCLDETFSLSLTGRVGAITGWYQRDEFHDWTALSSPNNIAIIRPTDFRAVVQNQNCPPASATLSVGIRDEPTGSLSPAQQQLCPGGNVSLSVTSDPAVSIIKWQRKDHDATAWTTIAEGAGTTFVSAPVYSSGQWRALLVHNCGEKPVDPVSATVVNVTTPVISDHSVCPGSDVTLSVNNPGTGRYHWYTYENGQYVERSNSYSHKFTLSNVMASTTYYVSFENAGCFSSKAPVTVSVYQNVPLPSAPSLTVTDEPYNVTIHANNTTNSNVSYYWQTARNGKSETNSAASVSMPAAGLYYIRARTSNGCWSDVSAPVEVINHLPTQYQYAGGSANYVRTYTFQQPSTTVTYPTDLDTENNVDKLSTSTTYLDGLGRPIQQVVRKGSAAEQDLITPVEYDEAGRKLREYLPYASSSDGTGNLKTNPVQDQRAFYATDDKTAQSYFPFSYAQPERSPLDRPQISYAPGNDWAGLAGSAESKNVAHHYLSNTLADNVRLWQVDTEGLSSTSSSYAAGLLFVYETRDEHGFRVREFKTKKDKLILKRVQVTADAWADTYYIYDDFGNLVTVLPPEAVKKMEAIINEN